MFCELCKVSWLIAGVFQYKYDLHLPAALCKVNCSELETTSPSWLKLFNTVTYEMKNKEKCGLM